MQILPSPILADIIKHYLFLNGDGFGPVDTRLFSDGNTGIVFMSNGSLFFDSAKNKLPDSFLYGQIPKFKDIRISNNTGLSIVVFRPAGIYKLLGIPGVELRDCIIPLEDIFGSLSSEIGEGLAEARSNQGKAAILNDYFASIAMKYSGDKEQIVSASIDFILKNKGIVSSSQLIRFTGYTERHIERLFQRSIGIGPRNFANIIRLQNFLQYLRNRSTKASFTEISYEAGYSDQSHLIREFRKHTGMTPTRYTRTDKLAINFIALPSLLA